MALLEQKEILAYKDFQVHYFTSNQHLQYIILQILTGPAGAGEEPLATARQEHNCSTAKELLAAITLRRVVGPTISVFLTTQSS